MNVNDGPVGSRQFVANPPFFGSKVASITTPVWQNNPTKSYAIMVAGVLAFSVVLGGLLGGLMVELLSLGTKPTIERPVRRGITGIHNVSLSVTDLDETHRRRRGPERALRDRRRRPA